MLTTELPGSQIEARMARTRCGWSREVSHVRHIEAAAAPTTVDDDHRTGRGLLGATRRFLGHTVPLSGIFIAPEVET